MPRTLCIAVVSLTLSLSAQAVEPVLLDVKTTRVAMFKNGLGMVTVYAELPDAAGRYRIAPLPEATLGSLWLNAAAGLELTEIRTRSALVSKPMTPHELRESLQSSLGDAAQVNIADAIEGVEVIRPVKQHVLDFTASAAAQGRPENTTVGMFYLAQGIAWSPSYVVDLVDEEKARIEAKAVIVNDLIDLDETDVELIAGYPNIQFAEARTALKPEPLAQLLNQIRNAGRRREVEWSANTQFLAQRVAYDRGRAGATAPSMPATPIAGEGAEDLYFYQLPRITLKRGERGYFPLFGAEIPCTDLYTWEVPDYVDEQDRYQSDGADAIEVVWHSLKLTNKTGRPWTTAAAMTTKDGRVLGQDTLHYTPPAGSSRLRITQAVAIDAQQAEFEIERQRGAEKFHGNAYDKVTIGGTLTLTSYKTKKISIEITKVLSGEVTTADSDPQIVKLAKGMRRVNPRSRLTWEIEVPPGKDESVEIKYQYTFYTR